MYFSTYIETVCLLLYLFVRDRAVILSHQRRSLCALPAIRVFPFKTNKLLQELFAAFKCSYIYPNKNIFGAFCIIQMHLLTQLRQRSRFTYREPRRPPFVRPGPVPSPNSQKTKTSTDVFYRGKINSNKKEQTNKQKLLTYL